MEIIARITLAAAAAMFAVTAVTVAADTKIGKETVDGITGVIVFDAPEQLHRLRIVSGSAPGESTFSYSWPGGNLYGCLNNRMPDRKFKQKGGKVVVFARQACGGGSDLPIRGTQNGNGWDFEVDSLQNGTYSMKVRFDF
jgi:hypothetical protein